MTKSEKRRAERTQIYPSKDVLRCKELLSFIHIRCNYSLPDELIDMMLRWEKIYWSPYNQQSYYNGVKTWGDFQDGGIRISDHWNFETRGNMHCKTDIPTENNKFWYTGVYSKETDTYTITGKYDFTFQQKYRPYILNKISQLKQIISSYYINESSKKVAA